jgi:hypothetical protein
MQAGDRLALRREGDFAMIAFPNLFNAFPGAGGNWQTFDRDEPPSAT